MKIKLSELRQIVKSVIKEEILTESEHPAMGGATELFKKNGYEVGAFQTGVKYNSITLNNDGEGVTVTLKSDSRNNTIQLNMNGKMSNPVTFSTIGDSKFKTATIALGLDYA
jgi:hypothetical protein